MCLATVDADAAPAFGLRVAHLSLTAPAAFATGIAQSIFQSSTMENLAQCNLGGAGTFNWLLRFDTAAGTLTTGAALPVGDPSTGYTFIDKVLTLGSASFAVTPLTLSASIGYTCGFNSSHGDVLLPFFADASGTMMTILPLRSLRFFNTYVTPDHNCIGIFDSAGLSPASSCLPDAMHPQFLDGGKLEAFISLQDADAILIPPLSETLCVFLAGAAGTATPGPGGVQVCARKPDGGIFVQGDWCSKTNAPAAAGCADAVRFAASFAASGTRIN
jgi:hypothetical protein